MVLRLLATHSFVHRGAAVRARRKVVDANRSSGRDAAYVAVLLPHVCIEQLLAAPLSRCEHGQLLTQGTARSLTRTPAHARALTGTCQPTLR